MISLSGRRQPQVFAHEGGATFVNAKLIPEEAAPPMLVEAL